MNQHNLHLTMPLLHAGPQMAAASTAMILVHGRGASAEDILGVSQELNAPGMAFLAPQAANNVWYPNRFTDPVASNEPWLTWALDTVGDVLQVIEGAGIPPERVILLGFSQGGCLALEFAARNPRRYGGIVGLSAGLIENGDQPCTYAGDLAQTPVLLGCSNVDPHIPLTRVDRTAALFSQLGAQVDKRIYPNMAHTINPDEIAAVQRLVEGLG